MGVEKLLSIAAHILYTRAQLWERVSWNMGLEHQNGCGVSALTNSQAFVHPSGHWRGCGGGGGDHGDGEDVSGD